MAAKRRAESTLVAPETVIESERRRLHDDGYVRLDHVLTPRQLRGVDEALPDGKPTGLDDPRLDCLWYHPRVLGLVGTVLETEFHLQGFSLRESLVPDTPGRSCGAKLHTDWNGVPDRFYQCVAVFPLDPFRRRNGATRIVPGSHHWSTNEVDAVDPHEPHPSETHLLGKPGDAFVFNAHVLHAAGANLDGSPRRAIFAFYVRNDAPKWNVLPFDISSQLRDRLPEEARALLR